MSRNTKSLILQVLLLIFLPKTFFGQVTEGLDLTKLSKLNSFIEKQVKEEKLAGAEFLVARNNKIVMHSTRGFSNLAIKKKLNKNSIYFIQSMTKPIISVAIMQLYERNLLDFDDEISKYIPEANGLKVALDRSKGIDSPTEKIKTPITIGQLLSHFSGLSHGLWNNKLDRDIGKLIYGVNYPFFTDYSLHKTVESRAKALLSAPLMFQPGTDWYYSAGGDLLAVIIEKVTKQTVSSYLKENIFNPLGMNDTGYNVDKEDLERVMQLHYTNNKKKFVVSKNQPPRRGTSLYGGTHGLYSTALDYLKFCHMLINGGKLKGQRVLKKKTVDLMKINRVGSTYSRKNQGFGYGFAIEYDEFSDEEEKAQSLYWGGYFNTRFFIDLKKDIVAIWMTQKLPNSSYEGYHQVLKKNVYDAITDIK
tara:strand:- start:596 stop:1852 length:1257 start_codon:yes stop_codon:yes gene_type:complete